MLHIRAVAVDIQLVAYTYTLTIALNCNISQNYMQQNSNMVYNKNSNEFTILQYENILRFILSDMHRLASSCACVIHEERDNL